MTTEIKEISNQHFEWVEKPILNEKGEKIQVEFVKKILSDKIITKKVIITCDDNGVEVSRENYTEPEKVDVVGILKSATPEQIAEIKQILA